MSSMETVKDLGRDLSKALSTAETSDESIERCKDVLQRLHECEMTLQILSETMIGKTVSQLKTHPSLGPTAKALVKKWKNVAKSSNSNNTTATTATTTPAAPVTTSTGVAARAVTAAKAPPPAAQKRASTASTSSSSTNTKKQKASVDRRNSTKSDSSAGAADMTTTPASDEWADLPPLRQTMCQKFYEVFLMVKAELVKELGINAEVVDALVAPRAVEVEAAIWSQQQQHRGGSDMKKAYTDKVRSLMFNLKKNTALTQSIILGQVSADDLVKMSSEQLAPPEAQKQKAEAAKKLLDSRRLDWEQANEAKINEMCGIKGDLLAASLFTCSRCKSTKTTSTQKQTRSADEPMTVFVFCLNCGKRWKC
jgi:transcription elongation factor S-II